MLLSNRKFCDITLSSFFLYCSFFLYFDFVYGILFDGRILAYSQTFGLVASLSTCSAEGPKCPRLG